MSLRASDGRPLASATDGNSPSHEELWERVQIVLPRPRRKAAVKHAAVQNPTSPQGLPALGIEYEQSQDSSEHILETHMSLVVAQLPSSTEGSFDNRQRMVEHGARTAAPVNQAPCGRASQQEAPRPPLTVRNASSRPAWALGVLPQAPRVAAAAAGAAALSGA